MRVREVPKQWPMLSGWWFAIWMSIFVMEFIQFIEWLAKKAAN